jgi:alpha-tubulin suppressor-like RCC1 family protein
LALRNLIALLLSLPLGACPRALPELADTGPAETDAQSNALAPPSSLTLVDPSSPVANDSTPTVRAGGVTAGLTVSLFASDSCDPGALVGNATAKGTTVEITTAALPAGVTQLHAAARDPAGRSSSCSQASLTYEYVHPVGVALGLAHGCTVLSSGRVACSGANGSGQLGDGTTSDSLVPVYVGGITSATAVTCGMEHSCALLADRSVRCWGQGRSGQLGNDGVAASSRPVPVKDIATATAIGARAATDWTGSHTCALLADGTVRCWGANAAGYLGNNSTEGSSTPVQALKLSGVERLGVGATHSCAVKGDGTAYCWGRNNAGQLGDSTTDDRLVPTEVAGDITSFVQVEAGQGVSCGLLGDQSVRCWGSGAWGATGLESWDEHHLPTPVPGLTSVVEVIAGSYRTCVRLVDGTTRCTGINLAGQIPGLDGPDEATFTPVVGITNARGLAMGGYTSCAITADHFLQCWGGSTLSTMTWIILALSGAAPDNRSCRTTALVGGVRARAVQGTAQTSSINPERGRLLKFNVSIV